MMDEYETAMVEGSEAYEAAEYAAEQQKRRGRPPMSAEQRAAKQQAKLQAKQQAKADHAAIKAERNRQKAIARLEREANEFGRVVMTNNEEAELRFAANNADPDILEFPPRSGLEFHPLCEIFPLLEGEEFGALVEDIKQHGQRKLGTIFEGMVLDGRNRLSANEEVGILFRARRLPEGVDPIEFVFSVNYHRRHLTTSQRAAIAIELVSMGRAHAYMGDHPRRVRIGRGRRG